MKQEELNQILENHRHWVNVDCEGYENMRADLHGADLHGAYMRGAGLYGADLYYTNLREANLCGADLRGTNMSGANLRRANMSGADLRGANLRGADLCCADLHGADLCGTDLRGADLCGAILRRANLCSVNLHGAKNIPHIPFSCPSNGTFIGWKKAMYKDWDIIVKLEIPEDAKRSSATGAKCRCDKAKVLGFYDMHGNVMPNDIDVWSKYDKDFKYHVGEIVSVNNFNTNRFDECAPGIHFFVDRQSAIDYVL